MGMNIKPLNGCSGTNSVSKSKCGTASSANKATINETVKYDSINISMEGSFRAELDKEVKTITSEINSDDKDEKIAEIKEELKSGTYSVSSEKIVDSIIERLFGHE